MTAVRASSARAPRTGPFVISPRVLLVASSLLAIAMGLLHVVDELQLNQVGTAYAAVAVVVSLAWLVSVFFTFRGSRIALTIGALIAFTEFATQAVSHFTAGPQGLSSVISSRGLGFAVTLLLLEPACVIACIAALICVTNATGTTRQLRSFPVLLLALVGSSLVLLHAADDIGRAGFGKLSIEDGTLVAMLTVTVWVMGALWMATARRRGALLVAAATLNVVIPFYTLHLAAGGVSLPTIAAKSGVGWSMLAAAMAGLALFSLVAAIGWLALTIRASVR